MLFVGGSRAHHYQDLFAEIGMKTISAGYEFAHRDDYEGRKVLPEIKIDADSRNIEELEVLPDPDRYRPRKSPEQIEELAASLMASNAKPGDLGSASALRPAHSYAFIFGRDAPNVRAVRSAGMHSG